MLQVVQHQKTGEIEVLELPAPALRSGWIVVRTAASLISAGTERASVEKSKASLLERARKQPDDVRQVVDMVRKEGVVPAARKVLNKLDSYRALGYSAAGTVVESGCDEFAPGDRVACAGAGYAVHAGVIAVPKNLAVRIPDTVSFEEASFTTLGAIALQGVRQADLRLGETVAVIGLGLLGQISTAMLKASGCRVIGVDVDSSQFDLARRFGADEVVEAGPNAVAAAESFSRGIGADAVLITAATSSNDPIVSAIRMARKKGRIVVVGAVGMDLPRSPFYEKELEVTISCSYGPGRYDPSYEEEGHDYPPGYVRWTENRNMSAVLDLVASGDLDLEQIITHRFDVTEAAQAYDLVTGETKEPFVGIVLTYPQAESASPPSRHVALDTSLSSRSKSAADRLRIAFIGAGSFAQGHLLPHLQKMDIDRVVALTATPANARSAADKFGFAAAGTDADEAIASDATNALFIATQHDTHGRYVADGLAAGKQVFVEKPLAISTDELERIETIGSESNDRLMVGFNRRFSESFVAVAEHFAPVREPLLVSYRVNAGAIPPEHWVQRPDQGGRIVGEVCHFVDTISFLTGSEPVRVYASSIRTDNVRTKNADSVSITIDYADGSVGTVHYVAVGAKRQPKEYCEVFGGGRSAVMDDFRSVYLFSGASRTVRKFDGAKGHREEMIATVEAMRTNDPMPISFTSLVATTRVTFAALESLSRGKVIEL